jgi:hypothetical protein
MGPNMININDTSFLKAEKKESYHSSSSKQTPGRKMAMSKRKKRAARTRLDISSVGLL